MGWPKEMATDRRLPNRVYVARVLGTHRICLINKGLESREQFVTHWRMACTDVFFSASQKVWGNIPTIFCGHVLRRRVRRLWLRDRTIDVVSVFFDTIMRSVFARKLLQKQAVLSDFRTPHCEGLRQ